VSLAVVSDGREGLMEGFDASCLLPAYISACLPACSSNSAFHRWDRKGAGGGNGSKKSESRSAAVNLHSEVRRPPAHQCIMIPLIQAIGVRTPAACCPDRCLSPEWSATRQISSVLSVLLDAAIVMHSCPASSERFGWEAEVAKSAVNLVHQRGRSSGAAVLCCFHLPPASCSLQR